jgi:hypothetical protein
MIQRHPFILNRDYIAGATAITLSVVRVDLSKYHPGIRNGSNI